MNPKHTITPLKKALYIFRRDLRLEDNTGLNACLSSSYQVIPCFIFDEKQITPSQNPYHSQNSVQFMIESLFSLNESLHSFGSRLLFFKGTYPLIIEEIIKNVAPEALFLNEDYTPYARERDEFIAKACKEKGVKFNSFHDVTLLEKDKILLASGAFYKKFTPYYRQASGETIRKPIKLLDSPKFVPKTFKLPNEFPNEKIKEIFTENKNIHVHGGREEGLKHLVKAKGLTNYETTRDFPELNTTNLSAYTKFGCVSIREVYWGLKEALGSKKGEPLLRQLYWRDFYSYVLYYYPHVIKGPMKPNYANLKWENDEKMFEAWKEGKTGVPIVDAGMRSMNATGYMHNRLRMICSNFLIKVLLIDWRWGEKYFASKLVDYDIAQNNGGWQWSSGTGTDSQPYFRIFNPKLQSEKFDKNCKFIFKWLPELKQVLNKSHIHDWESFSSLNKSKMKIDYPDCVASYSKRKELALEMYKNALGGKEGEGYESEEIEGKGKAGKKKSGGKVEEEKTSAPSKRVKK